MSGAEEEENPQPKIVICTNGDHSDPDKYIMSTSDTNFRLQSTAGTLYNLGWNIPFEEDSIVTNGTVRVIAAMATSLSLVILIIKLKLVP